MSNAVERYISAALLMNPDILKTSMDGVATPPPLPKPTEAVTELSARLLTGYTTRFQSLCDDYWDNIRREVRYEQPYSVRLGDTKFCFFFTLPSVSYRRGGSAVKGVSIYVEDIKVYTDRGKRDYKDDESRTEWHVYTPALTIYLKKKMEELLQKDWKKEHDRNVRDAKQVIETELKRISGEKALMERFS